MFQIRHTEVVIYSTSNMSRLRTIGHAIIERLGEITELAGNVVFYSRANIESEFERRMMKAGGKCAVVRLISGDNQTPKKREARYSGAYSVTLFTVPVLTQNDAKDSDSLVNEVIDKLHGWWPPNVPSNGIIWLETGAMTFPDDPDYDVTNLVVNVPT